MTKGGSGKPKMLGRLIFGEKRKQHASPSRHRSVTRNGGSMADISLSGGGNSGDPVHKNPINIHDWAVWRMQLNEQMGHGMSESSDLKHMRQFLHSNSFYKQHSRDPSNGRYNGVRLLFSIPHAKLKPESIDGLRGGINKNNNMDIGNIAVYEQNHVRPNSDDRTTTSVNSVSAGPSMVNDKTINQLLSKGLKGNSNGSLHTNEQKIPADISGTRRSMRTPYTASDHVHSTLQKAVKDGNVLEKIKAFEMQAAAAQAESIPKLGTGGGGISNRMQSVASSVPSTTHRTLSPVMVHSYQHSRSPMPIQHESQQQYIRSPRNRYVHPAQHRRDVNMGPIAGRESRKGAHVLEPAHGDIILKRRTPSQKTANDEDYSMTAISSVALTTSQSHHHRPHHYHHRTSASRSRHRQEPVYDKRTSNYHETTHKKHQQKQKEPQPPPPTSSSSSTKPNTRRRWLKGRKETSTEPTIENVKQDEALIKSNKNTKTKKKNNEKEKSDSTKKSTIPIHKGKISSSDNNRVYGVPNPNINEQTKLETILPQSPSKIEEENESDREDKNIKNKMNQISSKEDKEENLTQNKESNTNIPINSEQRTNKIKYQQKLSSTDGEVLSKAEDETRFSRPTDDHAHRSELNDEDDECKSEGDVFIEESSVTNINSSQQQSSNIIRRNSSQGSTNDCSSDRRWQWSKESGGLIDKGTRKKKQQPITNITCKAKINQAEEDEQVVYEAPESEKIMSKVTCNDANTLKKNQSSHINTTTANNNESNNKQISKQILHSIMNSMNNNSEQPITDEFFENGPHTNPEENIVNITSSA